MTQCCGLDKKRPQKPMYWKLSSQPWLQLRSNWMMRELSSSMDDLWLNGWLGDRAWKRRSLRSHIWRMYLFSPVPSPSVALFSSCYVVSHTCWPSWWLEVLSPLKPAAMKLAKHTHKRWEPWPKINLFYFSLLVCCLFWTSLTIEPRQALNSQSSWDYSYGSLCLTKPFPPFNWFLLSILPQQQKVDCHTQSSKENPPKNQSSYSTSYYMMLASLGVWIILVDWVKTVKS